MQDFFLWVCINSKIKSWGTSHVYIRQFQQLYTQVTGSYVDRNDMKELCKYHTNVLVPHFGLRAPNIDGKPVLNVDSLRAFLTFNITYDTGIVPLELQRVNLSGCYMVLCYTKARPAKLINNERKRPKNGSVERLFGAKVIMSTEEGEATDESSRELDELLSQETIGRDGQAKYAQPPDPGAG